MSEDLEIKEAIRYAEELDPAEKAKREVDVVLGYWVKKDFVDRSKAVSNLRGRPQAEAGSRVMGDLSNVLWAMSANYDSTDPQQREYLEGWDKELSGTFTLSRLQKDYGLNKKEADDTIATAAGAVTTNTFVHLLNGVTGKEYSPSLVAVSEEADLRVVDLVLENERKKTMSLIQLKTTKGSDRSKVNVWRVEDSDYSASYWKYLNNKEDIEKMNQVVDRLRELNPDYKINKYVATVPSFGDEEIDNIFGIPKQESYEDSLYYEFEHAAVREGLISRREVEPNVA